VNAEIQACAETANSLIQASPLTIATQTQVSASDMDGFHVDVCIQTDAPPAGKPGTLRARRMDAEEASQQLAAAREKLALEREMISVLEQRLHKADRGIGEIRHENEDLRKQVAAAKLAAIRPPCTDKALQASVTATVAEAQTDRATFWSHSWRPRPDSASKSSFETVPQSTQTLLVELAVAATQTKAQPILTSAATQTPHQKPEHQDACVGDEEPLRLALGASDLQFLDPPWRMQFADGMQVLAQHWRERFESSESEQQRLGNGKGIGNDDEQHLTQHSEAETALS